MKETKLNGNKEMARIKKDLLRFGPREDGGEIVCMVYYEKFRLWRSST